MALLLVLITEFYTHGALEACYRTYNGAVRPVLQGVDFRTEQLLRPVHVRLKPVHEL